MYFKQLTDYIHTSRVDLCLQIEDDVRSFSQCLTNDRSVWYRTVEVSIFFSAQ